MVRLRTLIDAKKAELAVVGLGYVGIAVAASFARAGFRVTGIDVNQARVARINEGKNPLDGDEPELAELLARVVRSGELVATHDYEALRDADVIFVCVETPITADHRPRFLALDLACESLGRVMKEGALVVVESTVSPGTTEGRVAPLLAKSSGRAPGVGFHLGHCPERVMPGKLLANMRDLARVCGAATAETREAMIALYRHVVTGDLDGSDCVTAELTKTAENTYRDVNIALANELALICEAQGADFRRVRDLVNKSPGRNVLMAGAGVGGHCIPKDPWLLAHGAPRERTTLIAAARAVNDRMPLHVAALTLDALAEAGREVTGARVAVLGYSYLPNSGDARHSPSEALVARLEEEGAHVAVHDPWHRDYDANLWDTVFGADAVVLMVAHDAYAALDLARLGRAVRTPVLIDGRHMVEASAAAEHGFVFRAVGRGASPAAARVSPRARRRDVNAARGA